MPEHMTRTCPMIGVQDKQTAAYPWHRSCSVLTARFSLRFQRGTHAHRY